MNNPTSPSCPNCQSLQEQLQQLHLQFQQLQQQFQLQQQTIDQLQVKIAKANKNSQTSSKPPSSDIVQPPKNNKNEQQKRKTGGQPGHTQHQRLDLPQQLLDSIHEYYPPPCCPDCGQLLLPSDRKTQTIQQIDLPIANFSAKEHRVHAAWCPSCDKHHLGNLPCQVQRGGLLGPNLTTLVAFLKGCLHASFSTIRKYLRDVLGVTIARGTLHKTIQKVSQALDKPYQERLDSLPSQRVLNVDETGHKENGRKMWTWCFRAGLYTLFHIDPYRSGDVLIDVLGREFDGVLGCDYFSAYRRFHRECDVRVQFCLAHLIRDVKWLMTLPQAGDRSYGERLRESLRELFGVIHRQDELSKEQLHNQLCAARDKVLTVATTDVPPTRHSQNMAKRFEKHGAAYFEFITTPEIEATNNLAEQAIRFVVIDRRITQGTRSEAGRRWCERIWTVISTCDQQGRSVWEYLQSAVLAWFSGESAPSLLPGES